MLAVLIDGDAIRVAKPGADAATASVSQLLISIGQRYGQILQVGTMTLTSDNTAWRGSALIGPYPQAPDVLGCVVLSDGFIMLPAIHLQDLSPHLGFNFIEYANAQISVSASNLSVAISPATYISGYPYPVAFSYCCFRKPLLS